MQSLECWLGGVVPCSFLVAVTCVGLGSCPSRRLSRGKELGPSLPALLLRKEQGVSPARATMSVALQASQYGFPIANSQTTPLCALVQPWQPCQQSHPRLRVTTVRPIRGGHPVHHSLRIEYQAMRVCVEVCTNTYQSSERCCLLWQEGTLAENEHFKWQGGSSGKYRGMQKGLT